MKWVKRLILTVVTLLVLAVALPFLIPLNFLAPRLAAAISETIREPATIQSVRLALLPAPGVVIGGIGIGKLQDVKAERLEIAVSPLSLLREVKVINRITLEGVALSQDALGRMPDWFKGEGGPKKAVVKKVVLSRVNLHLNALPLNNLDGVIELEEAGGFRHAEIESREQGMKLAVQPQGERYRLDFQAHQWKPPVGPAVQFDTLEIKALASSHELNMHDINANLYGGTLAGSAELSWHSGWRLQGKLRTGNTEIRQIVQMLSPETSVSGRLDGDAQFAMHAREAGHLFDAPTADARFKIRNGVLYNFDLMGAVKSMSKEGTRGGQTQFSDFSGRLRVAGRAYYLRDLDIASGLLAAQGNLDISPKKELAGRVNVELKRTVSLVSVPLQVSGTLREPVLRPTTGAMAGAVAGTAVLGPGLGTSLGAKAGDFVEKVFK